MAIKCLVNDFEKLYLDPTFSDVKLCVGENRFNAHRAVLAARSGYFRTLLLKRGSECKKIQIECENEDAFRMVFKYMYFGEIELQGLSNILIFGVLDLARSYEMPSLTKCIVDFVLKNLSSDILIKALISAVTLNHDLLFNTCLQYADVNAKDVLNAEDFPSLPLSILIQLISRDTLCVKEMDLFLAVQRWIKSNSDKDFIHSSNLSINSSISTCSAVTANETVEQAALESERFSLKGHSSNGCTLNLDDQMKIMRRIRFSLMTIDDLMHVVKPSRLVPEHMIFDALEDQLGGTLPYRAILPTKSQMPELKVTKSDNPDKLVLYTYDDKYGITLDCDDQNLEFGLPAEWIQIEFKGLYKINNINMNLWDAGRTYFYSYCIEVSRDGKSWEKIIDYSKYFCRKMQKLYFEPRLVRFIRITTANRNDISIQSFEARFIEDAPDFDPETNVVIPLENIALNNYFVEYQKGSTSRPLVRIKDDHLISIRSGDIVIHLLQPYLIDRFSVKIQTFDSNLPESDASKAMMPRWEMTNTLRKYWFHVYGSIDGINWTLLSKDYALGSKPWKVYKSTEPTVCGLIKLSCSTWLSLGTPLPLFHFTCPGPLQ